MSTEQSLDALLSLLELERNGRDQALLGLRDAQSQAEHASVQARTLDAYRAEYVQRWTGRLRTGSSVELLQCYQGFMQRLDHAIGQQRDIVAQAEMRLHQAQQALREREQRLGSVEKLIERRQQQQHRHAARREQSLADEVALRLHERKRLAQRDGGNDTVT
ncbi:MAG: flagellar export protein FliJ [Burkholderiaceae bacterium]